MHGTLCIATLKGLCNICLVSTMPFNEYMRAENFKINEVRCIIFLIDEFPVVWSGPDSNVLPFDAFIWQRCRRAIKEL